MNLIVDRIHKSFGKHEALKDISFELNKNEVVGLLGRNGAGKTTLLRIISGVLRPDSGGITLGEGLYPESIAYRRRVAYLSEKNPLYPHLFVTEFLLWVAAVYELKDVRSRVAQVIDEMGLADVRNQKIERLSKGYRQRLGIAAAMVVNPDVLVLDEPVNGLDPGQIIQYRSVIRRLARTKKIILSSHLIQEIEELSDRIILIDQGEIKMDGPLATVKSTLAGNRCRIKLNGKISIKKLSSEDWVKEAVLLSVNCYDVTPIENKDIREHLFDWVVKEDRKILEMSKIGEDLSMLFEN